MLLPQPKTFMKREVSRESKAQVEKRLDLDSDCYPKVYKQLMLERVWRKGNPHTLLEGMQTSTATMENSAEIS